MSRRLVALMLVVALAAVACSGGSGDDGSADGSAPSSAAATQTTERGPENTGNPGTLVAPTTTTEAPLFRLGIDATVAFLDACVADDSLTGPCHCASGRLESGFSDGDLVVFEDRLTGLNDFSPEVAAALVDCRDATAPAEWSTTSAQRYVAGCTKGEGRLEDLCRCSVNRAQDVIPEARIGEFLESPTVQPNLVDFINTCI